MATSSTRNRSNTSKSTLSIETSLYKSRSFRTRMSEYMDNVYDSETGELGGKTMDEWGYKLLFFLIFYSGLALFFISVWFFWYRVILSLDSPLYSGPEEGLAWTPGVSHFPLYDPDKSSTLLRFSRANDTQVAEITSQMYEFLQGYERLYWESPNGNFITCIDGRNDPDPEKVCEFRSDWLRPCIQGDDYGFGDGQPCVILKLNRINDWVPEDYANIEEVPDEIKDVWVPGRITVKCFGEDPISRESLGEIEYYPYQGWSFDYFPFTGQQGYKSPLVAAKFASLPHRTIVFVTCKAYSKNMIYESNYRLGLARFELLSD